MITKQSLLLFFTSFIVKLQHGATLYVCNDLHLLCCYLLYIPQTETHSENVYSYLFEALQLNAQ